MFRWWKKKKPQQAADVGDEPADFDPSGTIIPLTVNTVVRNFVAQPPVRPAASLLALVRAGASELLSTEELWEVYHQLQAKGYETGLAALQSQFSDRELMAFLGWLAKGRFAKGEALGEAEIQQLVLQFRDGRSR